MLSMTVDAEAQVGEKVLQQEALLAALARSHKEQSPPAPTPPQLPSTPQHAPPRRAAVQAKVEAGQHAADATLDTATVEVGSTFLIAFLPQTHNTCFCCLTKSFEECKAHAKACLQTLSNHCIYIYIFGTSYIIYVYTHVVFGLYYAYFWRA